MARIGIGLLSVAWAGLAGRCPGCGGGRWRREGVLAAAASVFLPVSELGGASRGSLRSGRRDQETGVGRRVEEEEGSVRWEGDIRGRGLSAG